MDTVSAPRHALSPHPRAKEVLHGRHGLDPNEVIVHLFDTGDVLDRDDEALAFSFIGDAAPQFCNAIFDDDVDIGRPVLGLQALSEFECGLTSRALAWPAQLRGARLAKACIRLARSWTMPTMRPARHHLEAA